MTCEPLPIDAFLPQICALLSSRGILLLTAEPGAGKTTRIPPALSERLSGRILLIVPRRIAAKSAAERIASELGTSVGKEIGYAVRGESRQSPNSRILIVTTGVYLEMLRDDPALTGFSAVIFDEFHERSWQNDLGFTLSLEIRETLREDLQLLLMSATLETTELSLLLPEAATLNVPGRQYPVEIIHLDSASFTLRQLPEACARSVIDICRRETGNLLVFLPGVPEIEKTFGLLADWQRETGVDVKTLHGRLTLSEQNAVLYPPPSHRRRVILATNIAESSLTVNDIQLVLDTGWEKLLVHNPGNGMDELRPERISLDSMQQRSGRAGRNAPGKAFRLWSPNLELSHFPARRPPEISRCDLSTMALFLHQWGSLPPQLKWLTPPPESNWSAAVKLLTALGAITDHGQLTELGKNLIDLPVHPRIGAMLVGCPRKEQVFGCELAALLEEPLERAGDDLLRQWQALRRHVPGSATVLQLADKLKKLLSCGKTSANALADASSIVAPGFPDQVAQLRANRHYRLANGLEADLTENSDLLGQPFLLVTKTSQVSGGTPIIRTALALRCDEVFDYFSDHLQKVTKTGFDADKKQLFGVTELHLGALVLSESPAAPDGEHAVEQLLQEAFRRHLNLPPAGQKAALRLKQLIGFARRHGENDLPDWDETASWQAFLLEQVPLYYPKTRSFADLEALPYQELMTTALGRKRCRELASGYPDYYQLSSGRKLPIDYSTEPPSLSARIQDFYGLDQQPCLGKNRLPLQLILLSPAQRPVQITSDLPCFWRHNWELVRKEMRGRYPKHHWPEHPESAEPESRRK